MPDLTAAIRALLTGNATLHDVKHALDQGANPGGSARGALPPVHCAIRAHNVPLLQLLLQAKADINEASSKGSLPLHLAAYEGKGELVKSLLDGHADANQRDSNGHTALFFAPTRKVCELLVARKADLNVRNHRLQSVLHVSAHSGLLDALLWLAEASSAELLHSKDEGGLTVLQYARKPHVREKLKNLMALPRAEQVWASFSEYYQLHFRGVGAPAMAVIHRGFVKPSGQAVGQGEAFSKVYYSKHFRDIGTIAFADIFEKFHNPAREMEEKQAEETLESVAVREVEAAPLPDRGELFNREYYSRHFREIGRDASSVIITRFQDQTNEESSKVDADLAGGAPQLWQSFSDYYQLHFRGAGLEVMTAIHSRFATLETKSDELVIDRGEAFSKEYYNKHFQDIGKEAFSDIIAKFHRQAEEENAGKALQMMLKAEALTRDHELPTPFAHYYDLHFRDVGAQAMATIYELFSGPAVEAAPMGDRGELFSREYYSQHFREIGRDAFSVIITRFQDQTNVESSKVDADLARGAPQLWQSFSDYYQLHFRGAGLEVMTAIHSRFATLESKSDELVIDRGEAFSKEYYSKHFQDIGKEAFSDIIAKFHRQAEEENAGKAPEEASVASGTDAVEPASLLWTSFNNYYRINFKDVGSQALRDIQAKFTAQSAQSDEAKRLQRMKRKQSAHSTSGRSQSGRSHSGRSRGESKFTFGVYYEAHFKQAPLAWFAEAYARFGHEVPVTLPPATIDVEVKGAGPLGLGVVSLSDGGVGVSSVKAGGRVDAASKGKVAAGMRLLTINGQEASTVDLVLSILRARPQPLRLTFGLPGASRTLEDSRPPSRPPSSPDARPASSPDSRTAALQRKQGRSFEVEVTVDEGPLGIGLVPMPGGAVGVSSVKDEGSVKILSEGKVRAGMCFYKVNDTVVTDMDQALALVKTRPAKLLFVDIGKLRRRRRKERHRRSSNRGSETEDTDPFPERPPEGQHDIHGANDDPSGSVDGEAAIAVAARGRQLRTAPVAELVKAEREGCFTWEVVLTKASTLDKFGFVQASGRMDFEQRLQRRSRERTGEDASIRASRCRSRGQSSDEGAESDGAQDLGAPPGPQMLIVRRIHEGGLLDKWNQVNPNAQVQVRDRIANVNGHTDVEGMQRELKGKVARMLLVRFPERFRVKLSKEGGRKLGFCFEKPSPQAASSVVELRISEILKVGALPSHNLTEAARDRYQFCVLPEMRIEAVNGISGNVSDMVEAMKTCEQVELHIRREDGASNRAHYRAATADGRHGQSSSPSQPRGMGGTAPPHFYPAPPSHSHAREAEPGASASNHEIGKASSSTG